MKTASPGSATPKNSRSRTLPHPANTVRSLTSMATPCDNCDMSQKGCCPHKPLLQSPTKGLWRGYCGCLALVWGQPCQPSFFFLALSFAIPTVVPAIRMRSLMMPHIFTRCVSSCSSTIPFSSCFSNRGSLATTFHSFKPISVFKSCTQGWATNFFLPSQGSSSLSCIALTLPHPSSHLTANTMQSSPRARRTLRWHLACTLD